VPSYEFGGFRFDSLRRQLRDAEGKPLELPARSIDALLVLLERRGEDVSKEQLMKALWPNTIVEENNLSQAIFALRRALGDDAAAPRFVMTLPGRGYRFIAEPEPAPALPVPQPPAPTPPPPPVSRRPIYIAFGVAALVAFGAVAVFWPRSDKQDAAPVSVAVLPFTALVAEQSDPPLELGMTDTLISQLGTVRGVTVSSLNAVRRVAVANVEATEAGKALGVEAVLESTILRQGERIRVSSRLIRVRDGQSLWVGKFDEPISDIFAVQDSIVERVMRALAPQLASGAQPARPHTTENAEAYQLYLSGFYQQQRRDIDGLPMAVEKFEAAILMDRGYAQAWGALSRALAAQGVFGTLPPMVVFPRAKEAALNAVELDPDSAEAQAALAHVLAVYDRKYREAEQHYTLAQRLSPATPEYYLLNSINQANLGRPKEAIAEARRALEIEPASLLFSTNVGMLLYFNRSYDEAETVLRRVVELQPRFDHARNFLGRILLAKGDLTGALAQFAARSNPTPGSRTDPARVYALANRRAEALAEIEKVRAQGAQGFGVNYDLATIYLALGDKAQACQSLQAAFPDRSAFLGFLQLDPAMDALRAEPCYVEIARKLQDAT
jgi:DNA-binding winged helix-turn-helix (wHTH) protein/TolB-like protein/Flp pilus assembly protein TadD